MESMAEGKGWCQVAIINPEGLFGGERLAQCSDEAQLHWPRFFTASNTLARLELDYHKIISTLYRGFKVKPTEEQVSAWLTEYNHNFLLFVYDGPDGSLWGQWLTDKAYLSRYPTAADRRSPAPSEESIEKYRQDYISTKKRKSLRINGFFKPHQTISDHSKPLALDRIGVG